MSDSISPSMAQTNSTTDVTTGLNDNVQDVVMSEVDNDQSNNNLHHVNDLTTEQIESISCDDKKIDGMMVDVEEKGSVANKIKKDRKKTKHKDGEQQEITNGHNGTEKNNNNGELESSSAEATSSTKTPTTTKGETSSPTETARKEETKPNGAEANQGSKKQKKKEKQKSKSKAEERMRLSNPDKIVEAVLEKSTFKVPNLSQVVSEQLYAPDFEVNLSTYLKTIRYKNTVGDGPIGISVLPSNFDPQRYKVNVNPSAVTSLGCIYEKPEKRFRGRAKKGRNRRDARNRPAGGQGKERGSDRPKDGQSKKDEPQKGPTGGPTPKITS